MPNNYHRTPQDLIDSVRLYRLAILRGETTRRQPNEPVNALMRRLESFDRFVMGRNLNRMEALLLPDGSPRWQGIHRAKRARQRHYSAPIYDYQIRPRLQDFMAKGLLNPQDRGAGLHLGCPYRALRACSAACNPYSRVYHHTPL